LIYAPRFNKKVDVKISAHQTRSKSKINRSKSKDWKAKQAWLGAIHDI
jgi:hypothetical protein